MLKIEEWLLSVDLENTKRAFEFNSYRCIGDACTNFVTACKEALEPGVLEFAKKLGIDLSKPSQLNSHLVNNDTEVMYSGKYHVIGKVLEGEFDAWDIILGQHCFSLTNDFDMVPIVMDGPVIEISFEVVLPWVLKK